MITNHDDSDRLRKELRRLTGRTNTTGRYPCHCRKGVERANCPDCEGTGYKIDFRAVRALNSKVRP
jgi:hypothetical protein